MNSSHRWLNWSAPVGLLALIIILTSIMLGLFDPKPVGHQQWQRQPGTYHVPAQSEQRIWLDPILPEPDYSLRLSAAWRSGDPDTGYGLLVGSDDHFLAVAVSSLGYVAVWQQDSRRAAAQVEAQFLLPWQTWPHVRSGSEANEIWLDRRSDQFTIRLNRELLWQGKPGRLPGEVGLIAESFGEMALIEYLDLRLFAE